MDRDHKATLLAWLRHLDFPSIEVVNRRDDYVFRDARLQEMLRRTLDLGLAVLIAAQGEG